ncbi:hypothetical protein CJF30_00011271 [Rutstroemia sp. NJR-2017a BBW]|nr:hypothetical protein CJF30_00011271 [Rutstroemia sp. NJR-2017a BBW]
MPLYFSICLHLNNHDDGDIKSSRDDRLKIQMLYNAVITRDKICLQLDATYDQVCDAIRHPATPQKKHCDCSEKAIRKAFKKEGFIRAVSRKKPALVGTKQGRMTKMSTRAS